MLSVCDVSAFSVPLSRLNYHIMSDKFKYNFIRFNYRLFTQNNVEQTVKDYRLFSYLYNNCSVDDKRREAIGNVVLFQLNN